MRIGMVVTIMTLACGAFWGVQAQDGGMPGDGGMMGVGHAMAMPGRMGHGGEGMEGIGRMGNSRGPNFFLRFRDELGLDKSQVEKIKAVRLELVTQTAQVGAKLAVSRAELRDLLDNELVALDKVSAKVAEISDLRGKLLMAGIKAHVDASGVLNDDQRKKVESLGHPGPGGEQQRGPGMGWRGRRGGGMFGPGMRGRGLPFPGMRGPDPVGPGMGDGN